MREIAKRDYKARGFSMTPHPGMIYEVTCITIYEEEADSADEAKAIVERNCPDCHMYMVAKKLPQHQRR